MDLLGRARRSGRIHGRACMQKTRKSPRPIKDTPAKFRNRKAHLYRSLSHRALYCSSRDFLCIHICALTSSRRVYTTFGNVVSRYSLAYCVAHTDDEHHCRKLPICVLGRKTIQIHRGSSIHRIGIQILRKCPILILIYN